MKASRCSHLLAASCCNELRSFSNTPIVTPDPRGRGPKPIGIGVQVHSSSSSTITLTCFVSNQETCPKITQEQDCDQLQLVTFNGLDTGIMYRVGCTCRFQGVVRTITRSFSTPHSHLTAMPTSSMMGYHISTTPLREMQPPTSCGTVPAVHLDSVAASTQGHLSPVSSHLVCVCVYLCVHVFIPHM